MFRRSPIVVGLVALVAVALASASSGQPASPAGPPSGSPPGLDEAIAAKERHAQRLLDKPGIAGIGVGLNPAGKPIIRIYKETPDVADVPDSLDGVAVQSVTTGILQARAPTDRFPRPVPIGVSSGHLNTATGTLGARVTNGTNVYALSNNHVYAAINDARIGDGIIQPGNVDGGTDPADRIGTLHDFQTISFADGTTNTIDAAIALTSTANVGTATPADGYGTPSPITTPAFVGQAVQKYGRTTGLQLGTVAEINVTLDVCYVFLIVCFEDARFVNQIAVTPDAFSAGGDSGSLIVTQGGNQPVALLFAGGEGRTIGNPIDLVLQRFGVTIDGAVPPDGPPSAPTSLSALAGDGTVSLSWTTPSFDGGSPLTGYRVYRGTSPNPTSALSPDLGVVTSFQDSGLQNATTYYYKVSALNATGESPLSNEASTTPTDLVLPSEPLPTLDDFNRANENPLSDGGKWGNGVNGSVETGLNVVAAELACSKTTTCTAWRSNVQYGPDAEVWTRVGTLPGVGNAVRLYVRLQTPGSSAVDGYMLLYSQLAGTDQVVLYRITNGALAAVLTVNQELAAGDRLLLRAKGSTLEAWRRDTSSWSRLGVVNDSTYGVAGYAGIGLRGTTGRLDDFGARTPGAVASPPGAPTNLSAVAGNATVSLSWSAPAFDGGSAITNYKVYRGTSSGGETFLQSVGAVTSFQDTGLTNGTTAYYKVSAENAIGESALSNEASATPTDFVLPTEPLPVLDGFNRTTENPLSDGGKWGNGIIGGSTETGLNVTVSQLACSKTTTCTAWRSNTQYGPDSEVWTTIATPPGDSNAVRLYARLQQPGTAGHDGYMLRASQLSGIDQIFLDRIDNGAIVNRLTVNQELAGSDILLLRAEGPALEAWRYAGSWSRLGVVQDSTYGAAGYVGVGLRGTTGRLDDFGARTPGAVANPPGAPTNLSAVAGNATVSLSWSAPALDGGSPITGYKVYRGTSAGGETFLANASAPSYSDGVVTNGTTYYYKVSALNQPAGEGALSGEASATPTAPPTTPSAPTNLQALAGNASVSLSWSAPAFDGGSPLTGYMVYRGTSSGAETFLANAATTSYTDTTVSNGTTYYYKVSALNASGEGPPSNEAQATPTANPPGAPTGLSALAGNGTASLTWNTPASDGGSPLTGYRVYRGTSPNPTTALTPDLGVVTSFQDSGLSNGTTYYYKVSALNQPAGEGPPSNEAQATPTDLVPPIEPLPTPLDNFNRANENPLSDAGRWGRGIIGSAERSLKVVSNRCASDRNTTATAWRNNAQFGPNTETWATITTLPGNGNAFRLYVRLQAPGSSAVDGYMLLFTQSSGTDQIALYRITNGVLTSLQTVSREVPVGSRLLLRAQGTALESWVQEGSTWTRLGRVTDSTYGNAGYVGVGIRGKTGRLDDFGAR